MKPPTGATIAQDVEASDIIDNVKAGIQTFVRKLFVDCRMLANYNCQMVWMLLFVLRLRGDMQIFAKSSL